MTKKNEIIVKRLLDLLEWNDNPFDDIMRKMDIDAINKKADDMVSFMNGAKSYKKLLNLILITGTFYTDTNHTSYIFMQPIKRDLENAIRTKEIPENLQFTDLTINEFAED